MGTWEISEAIRVALGLAALCLDALSIGDAISTRRALVSTGMNGARLLLATQKIRSCLVRLAVAVMLIWSGALAGSIPSFTTDWRSDAIKWGWCVVGAMMIGGAISAERTRRRLIEHIEKNHESIG